MASIYIGQSVLKFVCQLYYSFAFGVANKWRELCVDVIEMKSSYFVISSYSLCTICSLAWKVCKPKSLPGFYSKDSLSFFLMSNMGDQMNIKYTKNFSTLIDGTMKVACFKIKESTGYFSNKYMMKYRELVQDLTLKNKILNISNLISNIYLIINLRLKLHFWLRNLST